MEEDEKVEENIGQVKEYACREKKHVELDKDVEEESVDIEKVEKKNTRVHLKLIFDEC